MEKKRKEVEARAKRTFQSMAARSLNSLPFVKVCRYEES